MTTVIRFLLAGVFLIAGATKLADRKGSRKALIEFGVPAAFVPSLSVLLPAVELAVAAGLTLMATARRASQLALALLIAFSTVIGANLARGREPDCHCFGQLHSGPAGWPTFGRNVGLAGLSGILLQQRSGSSDGKHRILTGIRSLGARGGHSVRLGSVVLVLTGQGWLLLHLLRRYGELLQRIEALDPNRLPSGLPVGDSAPAFNLAGLAGENVSLDDLLSFQKPVALVFVSPSCHFCEELFPQLGEWQQDPEVAAITVVISSGERQEVESVRTEHGMIQVLLEENLEVSKSYAVPGTPAAVLINPNGTIATKMTVGPEAIQDMMNSISSPKELT